MPSTADTVFLPIDASALHGALLVREDVARVPAMIDLRLNYKRSLRFAPSCKASRPDSKLLVHRDAHACAAVHPGMQILTLHSLTAKIIARAEQQAKLGDSIPRILETLRELSLEDFGLLLISMPNPDFPDLSLLLPRMASEQVQQQWTGYTGLDLFAQTTAFARQLECAFVRHAARPLHGSTILDLGVGYGRNLRSMLYYSNPENLWGVDPWQGSLNLSISSGVLGNLRLSDPLPETLPVEETQFDLAFAFSVFTHTSVVATTSALRALRKSIKPDGIFVCTVRPIEYWSVPGQLFSEEQGRKYAADHLVNGYGFYAHDWSDGTYGDASIAPEFFNQEGWKVIGYDSTITDKYQIALMLKPI